VATVTPSTHPLPNQDLRQISQLSLNKFCCRNQWQQPKQPLLLGTKGGKPLNTRQPVHSSASKNLAVQKMEPKSPDAEWADLAEALSDLRDAWVLMSIAFKDYFADTPSPELSDVKAQVERQLARIRDDGRRGL
jgi:hypothetical protein